MLTAFVGKDFTPQIMKTTEKSNGTLTVEIHMAYTEP